METTDNIIIVIRYCYSDELYWILLFAETFISQGCTRYILFPECGNFRQKLQNRPRVLQLVRPFVRRRRRSITFSFVIHRQKFIILYVPSEYWSLLRWNGEGMMIMGAGKIIAKVSSSVCVCLYVQLFDI